MQIFSAAKLIKMSTPSWNKNTPSPDIARYSSLSLLTLPSWPIWTSLDLSLLLMNFLDLYWPLSLTYYLFNLFFINSPIGSATYGFIQMIYNCLIIYYNNIIVILQPFLDLTHHLTLHSYSFSDKSLCPIYWKNIKKNINPVGWDAPFGMYIM